MIEVVNLVLYGLIGALSAMAFAATLAVIRAGRLKAIAFAVGFVAAQIATCAILVRLGGWSLPGHHHAYATLRAILAIGFGVWVLTIAWGRRRAPATPPVSRADERSQAMLQRLGRLHSATTFLAGVLLGVGGPKRLLITALAAASIAGANVAAGRDVALTVLYAAIATLIVWLPVLAFLLVG